MANNKELRLPALEVRQSKQRLLYSFAIDGKLLPKVTTISRIVRDQNHQILGYQRHRQVCDREATQVLYHISWAVVFELVQLPPLPGAQAGVLRTQHRLADLTNSLGGVWEI